MASKYPNIPGVNMSLRDGQLTLSNTVNTPRVLIIGNVPGNTDALPEEPVLISNVTELRDNFGGFFIGGEPNELALEWKAVQDIAATRTYLMALKGKDDKEKYVRLHNQLFGYMSDFAVEHIVLTGLYADKYVEGIKGSDFLLAEDQDAFPQVKGILKMGNVLSGFGKVESSMFPLEVQSDKYDTLKIINTKTKDEKVITIETKTYSDSEELFLEFQKKVNAVTEFKDVIVSNDNDVIELVSEDPLKVEPNGTISLSRVLKLTGQSSVFKENDNGKKIVGSPAHLIATYAEEQSMQFNNTLAYATVAPPKGVTLKEKQEYVNHLIARDNNVSKYVSVIAGPQTGVTVEGSLRTQWTSGAGHYAGLVTTLAPHIATTNQELAPVNRLRWTFAPRNTNDLIAKKYVTFMMKNNQIVVADGITTAPDLYIGQDVVSSDYIRLSTLRITNFMITSVRQACEPYIGKPNEFSMYNSMNTAIKSVIQASIDQGVIQDAKFKIELGATLDKSEVKLQIVPQFELRVINVDIGLVNPTNVSAASFTTPR